MSYSVLPRVSLALCLLIGPVVAPGAAASLGTAQASGAASADQAQVCSTQETWLEIHVGETNRGTVLTRLVDSEVWLDPEALRSDEKAYFDAEISCGTERYVRLIRKLSPTVDTQKLTLTVQPAPEVLAGRSLTVRETAKTPVKSQSLFFLDYVATASGDLRTLSRIKSGIRARYLNGPVFAAVGLGVETTSGDVQWLPSAQVGVNISPTFSAQLVYNATDVGGVGTYAFSASNALLFTGIRLQRSNIPMQVWQNLTIPLPFQAHLRVRVDGLIIAEYDVAPGPLTLHDLPLYKQSGQIEVEIRDETGTRTVLQNYSFPGRPPGNYDLSLDAGLLNATPYLGVRGRVTLSPQVDVEGSGRVIGTAVQGQIRAVAAMDERRSSSVGLIYNSQQTLPLELVGRFQLMASPFTTAAFATIPVNDVTQTQVGFLLSYRDRNYAVRGEASVGARTGLNFTLRGDFPISPALTLQPTVTLRRDAVRATLTLDYRPDGKLTVRSGVNVGGNLTGSLAAQYRLSPTTQIGLATNVSQTALNLHYADRVKVDSSFSTRGAYNLAIQGSAYVLPGGIQFDQGMTQSAFVTLETGIPGLQIFANGQPKGRTDPFGRLIFSTVPSRALTVRIDTDGLPFDVTLKSDTESIDLPGPGSYQLDWRNNFVHSRFVTFHWTDGTLATNATLRFEDGEVNYTDGLGIGFLPVSTRDRRLVLVSQDGTQSCTVTVPANINSVACTP